MLTNLKEYLKPESLREAWNCYQKYPEHTLFSTGGLSTALREDEKTQIILDLKEVLSNQVEDKENELFIGGGMTINEAIESLRNHEVIKVLKQVGTNQIRNMATISGSIAQKYGWSDMITLLVAYKGEIYLYDEKGEYHLPIEEYLSLKERPIVLGVAIKKNYNFGSFHYISRTDYDVSQFNYFLCAYVDKGRILEASIGYGARPGYAKSLHEVEDMLKDLPLNKVESQMDKLTKTAETANVSNGFGLSQEYRIELLKVFLKRSLKELLESF